MPSLAQIVAATAEKTGLPKSQIIVTVETFLEEVLLGLCTTSKVKISRFGTFELRHRKHGKSPGYIKFSQSRLVQKLFRLINGRK